MCRCGEVVRCRCENEVLKKRVAMLEGQVAVLKDVIGDLKDNNSRVRKKVDTICLIGFSRFNFQYFDFVCVFCGVVGD